MAVGRAPRRGTVSESAVRGVSCRRSSAGLLIGAIETVIAAGLAVIVFSGRIVDSLPDGVMLYLGAAALVLAVFAWKAGSRGVVGGLQEPIAAVLTIVAAGTSLTAFGGPERGSSASSPPRWSSRSSSPSRSSCSGGRSARQPDPVRAVPGGRRVPRRGGMAAAQGRDPRGGWRGARARHDRRPHGVVRGAAMAARPRVRRADAPRGADREAAARDPGDAAGRARGVRGRRDRQRVDARPRARRRMVALRAVRRPDFMGALRAPSVHRRGLVGGGRAVGPDPRRRARRRARDPVQRLGQRAPVAPRPGHERGAPRRGPREPPRGRGRRISGYRAQPHRPRRSDAREREDRRPDRGGGAAGGRRRRRLGDRADPADDRRRRARLRRAFLHPGVGLGPPAITPAGRVRDHAPDPAHDRREGFLPGIVVGLVLAVVLFAVSYGRVELVREVPFGDSYRSNVDRPPAQRAASGRWAIACRSSA